MVEVFKILVDHYDERVPDGILTIDHNFNQKNNRGHTKKLYKCRARLKLRQKFVSHRVVDVWNNLPQHVIEAPLMKSFECRLDTFWESQYMKYNFKEVWKKVVSH